MKPRHRADLVADSRFDPALLGLLFLVCATPSCDKEVKAVAPPPPNVVLADVEQRTVPIVRDFTARTEAVPTVEVRARVAGVLQKVLFKEGTEVKEGQQLFVIQPDEYKAKLSSARAQLAKAEADLTRAHDSSVVDRFKAVLEERKADQGKAHQDVERYKPLAEAKAIPQQDLDTAIAAEKVAVAAVTAAEATLRDAELLQRTQIQLSEASVENAKADITNADLDVGYTTIASPITGIVGKLEVDQGNLVGKAEPTLLTTISSVDPIYADFNLSEVDFLRLASRVHLDPGAAPDPKSPVIDLVLADESKFAHQGKIVFVDREVDARTGTIRVRAQFPNPDKTLRPGQFARVRLPVDERADAVLVPRLAIQEQQGSSVVYVVDQSNTVTFRPITLAERIGDFSIAKAGLKAGERVIIEGAARARPGIQVNPVQKSPEKTGE